MKKFFVLFIFVGITSVTQAQTQRYLDTLAVFQKHFNAEASQSIYQMMNANMQQKLSQVQVESIVSLFYTNFGQLKSLEFVEADGTNETYLGIFEKGKQHIVMSLDATGKMNGLRFLPAPEEDKKAKMERNQTPLQLPFDGTWFTFWGGDTKAQNYHVVSQTQKHAFDFLIIGKYNRTYQRSGTRNEDYYAFGKPIYAVCDATVVRVDTGIPDNKPGEMNAAQPLGNSVMLKTAKNEYIVYAHFEQGTIAVEEGDTVVKGQFLGRCGNSGNSSEPHLHFHIQDGPNMMTSVGVKCFFERLNVNGDIVTDYSPVRLDRVAPASTSED